MYDPNRPPVPPGEFGITSANPGQVAQNQTQGWRVGTPGPITGMLPGMNPSQGPVSPGGFPANQNALMFGGGVPQRGFIPEHIQSYLTALQGWRGQRPDRDAFEDDRMGLRSAMMDWRAQRPMFSDYFQQAPASVPPMSAPNIG